MKQVETVMIDGIFFPAPSEIILVEKFIGKMLRPQITWNDLMPIVENIRNFKDPFKVDKNYVFGGMSVNISDVYPTGWNCHILGTLTRFIELPTGMHNYKKLPKYSEFISSEDLIQAVWLSVVSFINWYNSQPK